jgi:hypothetical protein
MSPNPGICLTTEEKARKTLSQGLKHFQMCLKRRVCKIRKWKKNLEHYVQGQYLARHSGKTLLSNYHCGLRLTQEQTQQVRERGFGGKADRVRAAESAKFHAMR